MFCTYRKEETTFLNSCTKYPFLFSTRAKSPEPVLDQEEAKEHDGDKVRLDSRESGISIYD